jgi:hypothetical protein
VGEGVPYSLVSQPDCSDWAQDVVRSIEGSGM